MLLKILAPPVSLRLLKCKYNSANECVFLIILAMASHENAVRLFLDRFNELIVLLSPTKSQII